jgi:hypothetical protein
VVTVLLLLAGGTGLVINHVRPKWLSAIQAGNAAPSAPGASSSTGSTGVTAPYRIDTTGPYAATISVHSKGGFIFQVNTVGNSWVQATAPNQSRPLFAGILPAGQTKDFIVQTTLQLQVGSAAAHINLLNGRHVLTTYDPPRAPYTILFRTD